ncbi:Core-2/I-branching beta-1,6-N-acetylglucosaminyltransferase family protein [Arabidopsis thaliana]|uniref:Core-2/I-branching beta-1,6-N-acetylglucosaminyltransferase family protein n=1 Tax=Arabidopsis thaliana TaxID=3702 RepID=F4HYR0_ARATH|nr:Core-2/I-branching beta-1,6-N-acetylglucosaminyltransferase family protein [Arabidopsis thaliana]AEE33950.1 Core-2/I-branching beta-1,6-N-acetylglucosaminyltransferase family protein [Arabidopsis thaliana]|eukprot:NP_974071.1 Core-2/I-branching beta-1,6-N-acetylglucosaminyltransferase family protein [Arabidopsis thaliana]
MPRLPSSRRGVVWFRWKILITISTALCILALFCINRQSNSTATTTTLSSSLSVARSRIPLVKYSGDRPKLAFLFLARRDLPLDFLWDRFFKSADQRNFSIYVHSIPGFVFDESSTRSHFFYNRQLKNSIEVVWGESSMIAAERLLLASALEDPSNQRFVLLSDSFLDKDNRYTMKMFPVIRKEKWRKGSQWISLIRSHAEVIVNDDTVFPVFQKFCKRSLPLDPRKNWLYLKKRRHNCIPDEHYVQTLLTMRGLENEMERRTVTYTTWNLSAKKAEAKSWHPLTFTSDNCGPEEIEGIKKINHVYYESEYRTEWCRANSKPVPCFLFARKFTRGAAMRLLSEGLIESSIDTTTF